METPLLKAYDIHNPLLISSEALLGSLEAAKEAGIDITESLWSNGIPMELLIQPKGFIAFHQAVNFLNDIATKHDCPHFGFLVGKHQPPLRFGAMGQVAKLSANLHRAIENAIRYNLMYSEVSLWKLRRENGHAMLIRHNRVPYDHSLVQLHDLAVTLTFKALKMLGGGKWRASSISLIRTQPEAASLYEQYFGSPVDFNQGFNSVIFPEKYLQLKISTADEELLTIVKSSLDSVNEGRYQMGDDIATKVYHHIRQSLGTNRCNLESISQLLGNSPRILQRELQIKGVTFRELLKNVRREVAEHYLRNSSIPLVDLAEILGYRNVSAFSRAFKNDHGMSPEQWKHRHA